MGALYEDVENFFGDIFAWYGRKVARRPLLFVIVPLLTCCLLGLGLFNIEYETDLEILYTPVNSRALRDRKLLRQTFDRPTIRMAHQAGNGSTYEFYDHQAIERPDFVELIIRVKSNESDDENTTEPGDAEADGAMEYDENGSEYNDDYDVVDRTGSVGDEVFSGNNVLSDHVLDEIRRLYFFLLHNITPPYNEVCARRNGRCVVDGISVLFDSNHPVFNLSSVYNNSAYPVYNSSFVVSSGRRCIRADDPRAIAEAMQAGLSLATAVEVNRVVGNKDRYRQENDNDDASDDDEYDRLATGREEGKRDKSGSSMEPEQLVYEWWNGLGRRLKGSSSSHGIGLAGQQADTSGIGSNTNCLPALALKLRFHLEANGLAAHQLSVKWQDSFIEAMKLYKSDVIDVAFVAADSLQIELLDHVGDETRLLTISIAAMLLLATATGCSCRAGADRFACVIGHVTLAYAGVVAALLAILGAFGLLSLLGSRFVNLCTVMPFLVLGIGADDMFQLITGWQATNRRDSTEKRMANTLRSAAVSITITSLTDLLAFCIGATSPFLSVRNFCACSGVAILLCYVNQLTFFSGCMVLHSRLRMTSSCATSGGGSHKDGSEAMKVCAGGGGVNGPESSYSCDEQTSVVSSGVHDRPSRSSTAADMTANHRNRKLSAAAAVIAEQGLCRLLSKFVRRYYPRGLLHWAGKCLVVTLFIVYIVVSSYGVAHVQESFRLDSVIPPESYYAKHLLLDKEYYWDRGLYVTFAVTQPHEYHRLVVQRNLTNFLHRDVISSPHVANGSVISWLDEYLSYRRRHASLKQQQRLLGNSSHGDGGGSSVHSRHRQPGSTPTSLSNKFASILQAASGVVQQQPGFPSRAATATSGSGSTIGEAFIQDLQKNFLEEFPQYRRDIQFSPDNRSIVASRFYISTRRPSGSNGEADLMLEMRRLAAVYDSQTSGIYGHIDSGSVIVRGVDGPGRQCAMLAYNPEFVFYERYVHVMKNTLLPVGVTMIGMLFVALVFIPHPIPVACVTVSMGSVVVGITGLMHFWGLSLSAITTIQIILGVGICVSFTVHTSHAFMTATGKNRNERVTAALGKVAVPILNGAASSLLSTLALALGNSYVFVSFYKTMILVFVLGVLHSVVFLPVLLSFVGPRRTSKPRVFMATGGGGGKHGHHEMSSAGRARDAAGSGSGATAGKSAAGGSEEAGQSATTGDLISSESADQLSSPNRLPDTRSGAASTAGDIPYHSPFSSCADPDLEDCDSSARHPPSCADEFVDAADYDQLEFGGSLEFSTEFPQESPPSGIDYSPSEVKQRLLPQPATSASTTGDELTVYLNSHHGATERRRVSFETLGEAGRNANSR